MEKRYVFTDPFLISHFFGQLKMTTNSLVESYLLFPFFKKIEKLNWPNRAPTHDAQWVEALLKKSYFVPKRWILRTLGTKIPQYFNLVHTHKPKFRLFWVAAPIFWSSLFPFLFPALLLSEPLGLHILCGCHKMLCLIYGQRLEMGPRSIIGIVGRFTIIFAPNFKTLLFNSLGMNAVDTQKWRLRG